MKNIIEALRNLVFENEEAEEMQERYEFDFENPQSVQSFIDKLEEPELTSDIQKMLNDFNAQSATITKEDIKIVYLQLKSRAENPRGTFDKAGRFYVEDGELLDVRTPSAKYPYSQMNAARTAKFLRALSAKYKCETLSDLEAVAFA